MLDLDFGIRRNIQFDVKKHGHSLGRWKNDSYRRKAFCKYCRRYVQLYRIAPDAVTPSSAKRIAHPFVPQLIFEAVGTIFDVDECQTSSRSTFRAIGSTAESALRKEVGLRTRKIRKAVPEVALDWIKTKSPDIAQQRVRSENRDK
jgi:hypothetical protein